MPPNETKSKNAICAMNRICRSTQDFVMEFQGLFDKFLGTDGMERRRKFPVMPSNCIGCAYFLATGMSIELLHSGLWMRTWLSFGKERECLDDERGYVLIDDERGWQEPFLPTFALEMIGMTRRTMLAAREFCKAAELSFPEEESVKRFLDKLDELTERFRKSAAWEARLMAGGGRWL